MRTLGLCVIAIGVLAANARADVPPPEGYVEACTVANEQGPGAECVDCRAWHGERDACVKEWGAKGYKQRCKTYGASAWGEVWCKGDAKPATPPKPPAPPPASGTTKSGGCEIAAGERRAGIGIAGIGIAGIGIAGIGVRVRSRSRSRSSD
jgi:hypothetical protein